MQEASSSDKKEEKKKQADVEKTGSQEKTKSKSKQKPAGGLSPNAKTRQDAGFSLGRETSPEAGTIDASQAKHTAQLSRTQMVRSADAALAAQARRLSPNVLILLY